MARSVARVYTTKDGLPVISSARCFNLRMALVGWHDHWTQPISAAKNNQGGDFQSYTAANGLTDLNVLLWLKIARAIYGWARTPAAP